MRLCMFDKSGSATLGARAGDVLIDLSIAAPGLPGDIANVLGAGEETMQRLQAAIDSAGGEAHVDTATVRYHVPIARPGKIICLGLNYADHAKEGGHAKPQYPSF